LEYSSCPILIERASPLRQGTGYGASSDGADIAPPKTAANDLGGGTTLWEGIGTASAKSTF